MRCYLYTMSVYQFITRGRLSHFNFCFRKLGNNLEESSFHTFRLRVYVYTKQYNSTSLVSFLHYKTHFDDVTKQKKMMEASVPKKFQTCSCFTWMSLVLKLLRVLVS